MSAVLLPRITDHAGSRAWLITFVDIILLLLTFFVLMYAMARPDPVRYAPIVQSYTESFSAPPAEAETGAPKPRSYVRDISGPGDDLFFLETALRAAVSRSGTLSGLQFRSTPQYLIISLPNVPGRTSSAQTAGLERALFDLGGVLANMNNRIAVIGQASTTAESWSNAVTRAEQIARALTQAGYDRPIATLARADAITSAGQDRQIEIVIMDTNAPAVGGAP